MNSNSSKKKLVRITKTYNGKRKEFSGATKKRLYGKWRSLSEHIA